MQKKSLVPKIGVDTAENGSQNGLKTGTLQKGPDCDTSAKRTLLPFRGQAFEIQ